jgi:hypothetical protein
MRPNNTIHLILESYLQSLLATAVAGHLMMTMADDEQRAWEHGSHTLRHWIR